MNQSWRKWIATVSRGEARILRAPGSSVSLQIQEGADGVFMMLVHTEHFKFNHILNQDECLIGPPTEIEFYGVTDTCKHIVRIPHCMRLENLFKHLKVRRGNVHGASGFEQLEPKQKLPQPDDSTERSLQPNESREKSWQPDEYYRITSRFIKIYANRFKHYTATVLPAVCQKSLCIFVFGHLEPIMENDITITKIKVFLCSQLFRIQDFKEVSNTKYNGHTCFYCCLLSFAEFYFLTIKQTHQHTFKRNFCEKKALQKLFVI